MLMAAFGHALGFMAADRQGRRIIRQQIAEGAGGEAFEHVADALALGRAGFQCEDGIAQAELPAPARDIEPIDGELSPAALGQALEVMPHRRLGRQAMGLGLGPAPMQRGLLRGHLQDAPIGLESQRLFHGEVIVHQEMPGQIDHGQAIGPPDAGRLVDLDGDLRRRHGNAL